jgi:TusA-related sulfurtransferase
MKSFDSRDTIPPLFLLQVTNACRQMRPGEKLEIIAHDANITADLKCILAACEHDLLLAERGDDAGNAFKIWLIERPGKQ